MSDQKSALNRSNVHPKFFNKYQALINQEKVIDMRKSYDVSVEMLHDLNERKSSQAVFEGENIDSRKTSHSIFKGMTPSISFDIDH